ncbi:zf-CGNR multi-domain protein [Nakamurella sp. YIM 132087]|uniref:Zf-CGNR multi-domain protein n=1 Tax=Nakamurella alba TaxID=2665158 RepID=A0A7K1FGD2_9ACTN|nr:ABATE domain-containing protein [Nakamurella alba]MTD13158.1 zf-CGNR multi-domain protein [Nakamurella alba]
MHGLSTMRSSDGAVWTFDPGALSAEFLLLGGPDELAVWDTLRTPQDLADWAGRCSLAVAPVAVDGTALAGARALRDALWRAFRARMAGGRIPDADLATINAAAAVPPLAPVLDGAERSLWQQPATGAQVVADVARDAVRVLGGPLADRIRECAADDCALVFVDTSRTGARRWCSMQRCGNRSKVRASRQRGREDSA